MLATPDEAPFITNDQKRLCRVIGAVTAHYSRRCHHTIGILWYPYSSARSYLSKYKFLYVIEDPINASEHILVRNVRIEVLTMLPLARSLIPWKPMPPKTTNDTSAILISVRFPGSFSVVQPNQTIIHLPNTD